MAHSESFGDDGDPLEILPELLGLLGNVTGRRVLDGSCGEGYLATVLPSDGTKATA